MGGSSWVSRHAGHCTSRDFFFESIKHHQQWARGEKGGGFVTEDGWSLSKKDAPYITARPTKFLVVKKRKRKTIRYFTCAGAAAGLAAAGAAVPPGFRGGLGRSTHRGGAHENGAFLDSQFPGDHITLKVSILLQLATVRSR